MRLRRSLPSTIAALTALALTGCASTGPASPADGRPTVVASTNVYGSIASAVGGDLVTVTSLITDPAADPHSYESTPADAARVGAARIVVLNGGGYDEFMPKLVESGADPARPRTVIDVSELSGLEPTPEAAAKEQLATEGHEHGEFNEHVWYSLPTVQKLATRLATDLSAADPGNAARYTDNAEAFNAKVAQLAERTAALGNTGARVAVTEPVPGYLIEQAGLVDATPEEFAEAIEEDTDPPAAVVQETLGLFTGGAPVRVLIVNAQTQTPTTDQVRAAAQTAGVPIVEMTETLPAGSSDYVGWMGGQIDALTAALGAGRTP